MKSVVKLKDVMFNIHKALLFKLVLDLPSSETFGYTCIFPPIVLLVAFQLAILEMFTLPKIYA